MVAMREHDGQPLLGLSDVARRLKISRGTAYTWARDGVLPVTIVAGRLRVPASALDQWLAEREREALDAVRGAP